MGIFYCIKFCSHLWDMLLLLLSRFSRAQLCATPETAAHQAPPSLRFIRQEHWSGLPFPSPMHESEKWKWSRSVVPDSQRPHGLQPTRLLCPWDFPGKSTGVGCHCLLREDVDVSLKFVSKSWIKETVPFNIPWQTFPWVIMCLICSFVYVEIICKNMHPFMLPENFNKGWVT